METGNMTTILSDHNVEGQVGVLATIWTSAEWRELWESFGCTVETLGSLGLADDLPDAELWKLCQLRQMILVTGNRNAAGEDSLEMVMRRLSQADSLPVLTIADPDRVMRDRRYAEIVAVQVLDILLDLDRFRGSHRTYIP
jgi:hypothetical protein